ncbi:hypothetical protein WR25_23059 [Diploscapter pachys]|uniref:Large ribosomal subunit protein mL51 n=1 Tax=Diploscapter pachys TaxID=2018661 RepID=A0A2A2JD40_9BILA|nr:hypothetical protein WR25_23059 [Diploscapter pachys]
MLRNSLTSDLAQSVLRQSQRFLHNQSSIPRPVDDREKKHRNHSDMGYRFRYHQMGVDPLPRIPSCRIPVPKPDYTVRDSWSKSQAHFGQNDYVDILGDGSLHPALLQYHCPPWLRGFPGKKRANELVKLIHYRNLHADKMKESMPRRWHELCKRIKFLLMHHNYDKQDELSAERKLGLWEPIPDYFYKDKSRRSWKDPV